VPVKPSCYRSSLRAFQLASSHIVAKLYFVSFWFSHARRASRAE
jgi:hypothetical protein